MKSQFKTFVIYRSLLFLQLGGSEVAKWLAVVSALASCARSPGFEPRLRRGKFVGPNMLPFVSFEGMT